MSTLNINTHKPNNTPSHIKFPIHKIDDILTPYSIIPRQIIPNSHAHYSGRPPHRRCCARAEIAQNRTRANAISRGRVRRAANYTRAQARASPPISIRCCCCILRVGAENRCLGVTPFSLSCFLRALVD